MEHEKALEISSKPCVDGVRGRDFHALLLPRSVWSKACRVDARRVVFTIRFYYPGLGRNGYFAADGDWVGSLTHRSFGPCIQRYLAEAKELSPH